ncbi:MAG: hypothetical protein ACTHOU_15975 [Aureliella sp.]
MLSIGLLALALCQLSAAATEPPATTQPATGADAEQSPAVAGRAEIAETQLPPYSAQVLAVGPEGLTVKLGAETRSVPLDQLLRTRFAAPEKPAASEKISVELADGSTVHCAQVTSDGNALTLTWADGQSVAVATRQVTSCQLQPLDANRSRQWQAIVESNTAADVLIVQRSPESLDKIEGVISAVTDSAVKFQFDGQAIDVQRSKLAGWKYYAPQASSRPKLLAVVRDRHGSSWMAQSLQADWSAAAAQADLKLVCGVELKLPLASLVDIDFSFGSMRFLADLEPIERKVQPRFALAIALPQAEQLFGPRPAAAESQRGATAGPGIEFMGSGAIVYRVPNDFRRLLGSVALAPDGPQFVPCKAQIAIEDKVVWEKTLSAPHEPLPVEIKVEPGKRVRLTVQAQGGQPVGDRVLWRQLRFVK